MQFRNDGSGLSNIIHNRFTAYIEQRIRGRRRDYLEKRSRISSNEIPVDFESSFEGFADERSSSLLPEQDPMAWENDKLVDAVKMLTPRERYILTAHVLDEKSFDELGKLLGTGYKGAASAYYRVIAKMRKFMGGE